jgi:hypothetical protein
LAALGDSGHPFAKVENPRVEIDRDTQMMDVTYTLDPGPVNAFRPTLHILVEEGLLTKAKAIEAIETVAELTRETAESDPSVTSQIAVDPSSKASPRASSFKTPRRRKGSGILTEPIAGIV